MIRRPLQAIVTTGLLVILILMLPDPALAHSGEGISPEHVITEVAIWTLAVAGVVAAIVAIFWLRARASRR